MMMWFDGKFFFVNQKPNRSKKFYRDSWSMIIVGRRCALIDMLYSLFLEQLDILDILPRKWLLSVPSGLWTMKAILCSLILIQVAANAKLTSDPLEVSSTGPRMKQVMRMTPSTTPFFSEAKGFKILHQARMVIFTTPTWKKYSHLFLSDLFERTSTGDGYAVSKIEDGPHWKQGKCIFLEAIDLRK